MYGIKAQVVAPNGVETTFDAKGYKTYSSMRTAARKRLNNRNLKMLSFYEYKITQNGFTIINKWELSRKEVN